MVLDLITLYYGNFCVLKKKEKGQHCSGKGMFQYFTFFLGYFQLKVINDMNNNTSLQLTNDLITIDMNVSPATSIRECFHFCIIFL